MRQLCVQELHDTLPYRRPSSLRVSLLRRIQVLQGLLSGIQGSAWGLGPTCVHKNDKRTSLEQRIPNLWLLLSLSNRRRKCEHSFRALLLLDELSVRPRMRCGLISTMVRGSGLSCAGWRVEPTL